MNFRLGLDIGIASIGWAIIETDDYGEPISIERMGVRAFESAENPKDGASLALPRREARSLRRRLRRKAHRLDRMKELFDKQFQLQEAEYKNYDIYQLRNSALFSKLSLTELKLILLHLSKHRGFKSLRKADSKDKEAGKLLTATASNKKYREEKGYRTVGEMIFNDPKFFDVILSSRGEHRKVYKTRNTKDVYDNTFLRSELEEEIKIIFDTQRNLGLNLSEEFCEKALAIFNSQRAFDEGPGFPSRYSGTFAVGNCVFEKEELRAPKASFSFEYFSALQKLNNIKIKGGGEERRLSQFEREMLIAEINKCKSLSFSQVRKKLKLSDVESFNLLTYSLKNKTVEEIEKAILFNMNESYQIRKCLDLDHEKNIELIDEIALLLSMNKSDGKIEKECKENAVLNVLNEQELEKITALSFKKFGNLSIKVLRKIIPHLEEGKKYNEAVECAGYDFKAHSNTEKGKVLKGKAIFEAMQDITSPIVKRSISQVVKVVNAIVAEFGSPIAVNIELARSLSKSYEERRKIKRDNDERFANNEKIKERIGREFGISYPSGQDIVKFRLYEEQGGKCAYSQNTIDVSRLFDPTYLQVDHIIPYSRSFNDSFNNKALVLLSENQKKGNRLPFEYFGETKKWAEFESFVEVNYQRNLKKKDNLLRKTFTEEESMAWKERSLNDTKYISKFVFNLINDYLLIEDSKVGKKKVVAVNGIITSYLRKIWGINKIREDGDKHHAIDAVVIAMATDGMIQRLTRFNKKREIYKEVNGSFINKKTGEIVDINEVAEYIGISTLPYDNFRRELEAMTMENFEENEDYFIKELGFDAEKLARIKPIFVSRMPTRKVKGQMHDETIRSAREIEKGYVISKVPLSKLKLNKDGEIEGYYNKESDTLLYNAILSRLKDFEGNGELAFKEKLFKPKANGENGNEVKSVKTIKKASGFCFDDKRESNKKDEQFKYADNSAMVRVDIFEKKGKYYGVPIYVSDAYDKEELPNKAVVAHKPREEWAVMDDTFEFKFSLHNNDLIFIEHKSNVELTSAANKDKKILMKKGYLYFKCFGISTATITCNNHDKSFFISSLGITTLKTFKKCEVDVLGKVSFIKKETRRPICFKKN